VVKRNATKDTGYFIENLEMTSMKKLISLLIILISINLFAQVNPSKQIVGKFEKEITINVSLQYLIYFPPGYNNDGKEWPLVLFLHGAHARGDDINRVKDLGPPMLVERGKDFPFILVSPQCPDGKRWNSLELSALLDEIENKYRVDKNRIYVTGLSLGGEGTWALAIAEPDRFAAIAPVCGRSSSFYLDACSIKHLPIWVFHGAKDNVVSPSESQRIVDALKLCGSNVIYTLYPETDHNAWTETYNNEELYKWLLNQSLEKIRKE
jgi:predicted peptidase